MMTSVDTLLSNAEGYADGFSLGGLPGRPASGVAIVACMDARLNLYGLLGLAEGDAHIIRNAGGLATEDVLRSLVVSQQLLGTTQVMFVHHTNCGMMSFSDDEVRDSIEAGTGHRPPFPLGAFPDLDASVRSSVAAARTCPFLPHRDAVRGFVYQVETGRLREITA